MNGARMRRLIVCADDFAMSEGISCAIMELAAAGKVNAVSSMTILPRWDADAAMLAELPRSVEIGLHLVLTDERPLTSAPRLTRAGLLPTAARLERMAMFRQLPVNEIEAEIEAQFERFERMLGRPPAFVDGHQHVHLLPTIRNIVIGATARRSPHGWLRSCEDRIARFLRRPFRFKAAVNALQAAGFAKQARRAGLRCNDSFAGLYDFRAPYADLFPRFLLSPGECHLVICHPGQESSTDVIAAARMRETAALRSIAVDRLAFANGLRFLP